MEFTCTKKDLQSGVSAVEKIVTTRSTLPIIGNILFDVGKKGVKISANNLELGMELGVKAKVDKEGSILVPAKTLGGIVSRLPDSAVDFKLTEEGMMKISYGESYFNVHTLPSDEFPVLPEIKSGKSFSIDPALFLAMVRSTIFSVSSSEDKHVLTGVLLEVGKSSMTGDSSNIRMIATDGYRLAKRGGTIKLKADVEIKVIVPTKTLQELSRMIEADEEEEEIKVMVSSDYISFKYKDVYLVSRLIQGQFPDYKQVIPKKSGTRISLKTKSFLSAAERAAIIASGSANIVRFEIRGKKVHLVASTPDVGKIEEVLEAEVKGEEKMQIAFNIRLIIDMLKVAEADEVIIGLTEPLGPGVLKEDEKGDYLYIVMPIRTQEAV